MKKTKIYSRILFLFSCLFFGTSILYLNTILNFNSSQFRENNDTKDKSEILKVSEYDPTIYINGNDDFIAQASTNGWDGNGTKGNPYIIRDLNISASSAHGIYIQNTDVFFIIENVTVVNGRGSSRNGFYLSDVKNGELKNNRAINNYNGFVLNYSYENILTGNNASNNNVNAFPLWSSSNNTLTNNRATTQQLGFSLTNSNGNNLTSNIADYNTQVGFGIYNCIQNNLTGNNANNNKYGFYLSVSSENKLIDNNATDNINFGFMLSNANKNTLIDNIAKNNPVGFELLSSGENNLMGNNATDNIDCGFRFENSASMNTLIENTAMNNTYGFFLQNYAANNNLTVNTAMNNTYGFYLNDLAYSNTLTNNKANNNSFDGFHLNYTIGNILIGNIANNNYEYGISLERSNYSTITYNILLENVLGCISEDQCIGNVISDNICYETANPIIIANPNNMTVEAGYMGLNLSWTAIGANPYNYTITLLGTGLVVNSTGWSSGDPVVYNIPDDLPVDTYLYMINFTDLSGKWISDTVNFTVIDSNDPVITVIPDNMTLKEGYTGKSLSWTATDLNPGNYTITLVGTGLVVNSTGWSSGNPVVYNIPDELPVGTYLYMINFTDLSGKWNINTVKITITEALPGGNGSDTAIPGYDLLIILSIISIISMILIIKKRAINIS